jgi:hypothetical protein
VLADVTGFALRARCMDINCMHGSWQGRQCKLAPPSTSRPERARDRDSLACNDATYHFCCSFIVQCMGV